MTDKNVFDFNTYRPYLQMKLGGIKTRDGSKSKFSESVNMKLSYLSQVLQEKVHISLEQAERGNNFFKHSDDESHYFLLMVQKDRSGTHQLKKYFEDQMRAVLGKRKIVRERIQMLNELKQEDRTIYYSSWIYAAVHIAVTIPEFQKRDSLSLLLGVPHKRLDKVLEFLIESGLILENKGSYIPAVKQIHLTPDTFELTKHHVAWRQRAIDSIERRGLDESFHYSGVVSLSEGDVLKVKETLINALKNAISIIKDSPEQKLCCMNLDFFEVGHF
jgi:uncharacterized protein (TIGR02147 family)